MAFDFDGTLADSVEFCLSVFDRVFEKYMGKNAPDREAIYNNFGMNEPGVLRFFMGGFNKEAEEDFYAFHRELHSKWCPEPFPGVIGLLEFLRGKGVPMTILTGRSETTCNISPGVMGLGQAAGAAAAMCCEDGRSVKDVDIRRLREMLIAWGAYLTEAD